MSERIIVGPADTSPVIVAPYAGDGDVEVSVTFNPASGRQQVNIATEEHADLEVRVNGRPISHLRPHGEDIYVGVVPVLGLDDQLIGEAIQQGLDAFWYAVARVFPSVTSGDMDPEGVMLQESSMANVVAAWLTYNHPDYRGEDEDYDGGAAPAPFTEPDTGLDEDGLVPLMPASYPAYWHWPSAGIVDARAFRIGESKLVHDPQRAESNLVTGWCGIQVPVVESDGATAQWANSQPDCPLCLAARAERTRVPLMPTDLTNTMIENEASVELAVHGESRVDQLNPGDIYREFGMPTWRQLITITVDGDDAVLGVIDVRL